MSRTWTEWWTGKKSQPTQPHDAAHDQMLRQLFQTVLDGTEEPVWHKASDIAQLIKQKDLWRLGYVEWQEAVPAVKVLAFEMREFDYCEISKGGKIVPEDVSLEEVEGGVRIRRKV